RFCFFDGGWKKPFLGDVHPSNLMNGALHFPHFLLKTKLKEQCMNKKQIIALIILAVGIFGFFFTKYEKGRVASAKGDIATGKSFLGNGEFGKAVGNTLDSKASQYDTPLMIMEMGSIVLVVLGIAGVYYFRKK